MSQVNKKLIAMMAPLSLVAAVAITPLSASAAEYLSDSQGEVAVSYTHLTLPTNREV